MSIIPPDGPGPWRDPYEYRRLVTLAHPDPGRYELTVFPGADLHDLVDVTATMPGVVYLDHRPLAPSDPAVVLTFRALPAGVPAGRPRPHSGGWLPATRPPARAGEGAYSDYQRALFTILSSGAYG
nr:hypothetical protein [Micromonospora sp. DSM 115978]